MSWVIPAKGGSAYGGKTKINMKSFKISRQGGCNCCKPRPARPASKFGKIMDRCHHSLFLASYILFGCLLIYSMMIFIGYRASDGELRNQTYFSVAADSQALNYLPNVQVVWQDTVFFMDDFGSWLGNPLISAIQFSSRTLSGAFVASGNALALVSEVLSGPPPIFAKTGP